MRTKFAVLLAMAAVCVTTALADWTPEVLVTGSSSGRSIYSNNGQKLVFASDGIGHVIWGGGGVGCNRYDPASGWGPDYQVSQSGGEPSIALDADGTTIHVVYGDSTLCYQKCVRKGDGSDEWGTVVRPYREHGPYQPCVASVPGDPNHVVACWKEDIQFNTRGRGRYAEVIGFIECISGVWGTPIRLDSAEAMRRCPSIAVAPNGDVFIAYFANDDNSSGRQIYVKTRHNGVWGPTVDATPGLGSDGCGFPAIEVNPHTGNPHVVFNWMRFTQISKKVKDTTSAACHTYRNSQGVWQPLEPISVPKHGGGSGALMHHPTLAFVSDGTACAAWCEYWWSRNHGSMYSHYSGEGGTWSTPAWLTSDPLGNYMDDCPRVAVDEAADAVHALLNRLYPGMGWETEIWWRSSALGTGFGGGMGKPIAMSQSGVELFPNPARAGRVTVQYSLPSAEPLSVTLLDVSGRAVRTQVVPAASSKGSFALEASSLNAGVYILKLESGTSSLTRKLVIQ